MSFFSTYYMYGSVLCTVTVRVGMYGLVLYVLEHNSAILPEELLERHTYLVNIYETRGLNVNHRVIRLTLFISRFILL